MVLEGVCPKPPSKPGCRSQPDGSGACSSRAKSQSHQRERRTLGCSCCPGLVPTAPLASPATSDAARLHALAAEQQVHHACGPAGSTHASPTRLGSY